MLKTILKLPLIANIHKKLTLKSPEMRFVFKIILNLQRSKTNKNINFKHFYNSPKLLLLKKKSPEMRFVSKIIINLQQIRNK